VAADAFVRLLQMSVLPYVTVSLIVGIGRLDPAGARRLFLRVGALVLVLWGLALAAVFLMPLAFPEQLVQRRGAALRGHASDIPARRGPSARPRVVALLVACPRAIIAINGECAVAQLIVRNLEPELVVELKRRAAESGRSAEAEHRELLRSILKPGRKRTPLKSLLLGMPALGDDADFARDREKARPVRL
jgi:plasmid stability protein